MNRRSMTGLLGLLAALLGIRVLYWLEDLIEGLFSPFSKILTTPIAVWPLASSSDDEDGPQPVFFRHEMRRSRKHRKSLAMHIRVYGEMSENRHITQVEYERFINKVRFSREALSAETQVSVTCHRAIQIQQLYEAAPPSSARAYQLRQQLGRLEDEFRSKRTEADRVYRLIPD